MNRWIADDETSARLAAVDRDLDECEALERLVWGRESRFWQTTAEVTGFIAFTAALLSPVVMR